MLTSSSQEVLAFVRQIAQMETVQRCHEYIDTEHILLSLLQTKRCAAYSLLSQMEAFPTHIYLEITRQIPPGPPLEPRGVVRPLSPKVRDLWHQVPEMMRLEYQDFPITVVLLIALLKQEGTMAQTILSSFGVTEEKVLTFQRKSQKGPEQSGQVSY